MTDMENEQRVVAIDGNEAVVHVAYRVSEVCSIYPITPSSSMAESADVWAAAGATNWTDGDPAIISRAPDQAPRILFRDPTTFNGTQLDTLDD